ncbi:MAG: hypothetical protein S4CHLAM37_07300 [Chlamydiia bacterium]|nr:hypothetical protein [Chlamydiia bacterium]
MSYRLHIGAHETCSVCSQGFANQGEFITLIDNLPIHGSCVSADNVDSINKVYIIGVNALLEGSKNRSAG